MLQAQRRVEIQNGLVVMYASARKRAAVKLDMLCTRSPQGDRPFNGLTHLSFPPTEPKTRSHLTNQLISRKVSDCSVVPLLQTTFPPAPRASPPKCSASTCPPWRGTPPTSSGPSSGPCASPTPAPGGTNRG